MSRSLKLVPRAEHHAPTVHDAAANPGTINLSQLRSRRGIQSSYIETDGRGLTAAAEVMVGGNVNSNKTRIPVQSWQREVWELRRITPELRFSGDRVARALSRLKFYIGEIEEPGGEPQRPAPDSEVGEISRQLFEECSQQIRRFGQHNVYSGESLIHITQDPDTGELSWEPYSTTECTGSGTKWEINDGSGDTKKIDYARELLIRAWNKDPERGYLAESPVQAVLPVARELKALTQRVAAEIDSRLAGNGLLVVPSEIEVLKGQAAKGTNVDDFVQALLEMMLTPIQDQASASAVVPLVAKVPADMIDKIQHIKFSSALDPAAKEMRDEAIRRIALGMDSDPSVLMGMGAEGSAPNHWCVDDLTQVYTQRGWLSRWEVVPGDVAMTLNHETGRSEWKPIIDMYQADVVDEPMRLMDTQSHNSMTTLNHRWPVLRQRWHQGVQTWDREWTTSEEFSVPHALITGAPHAEIPTEQKHTDGLVELVGWYWTEGSLQTGGRRVSIAQSHTVNAPRVDRIRAALDVTFPGMYTERVQPNHTSFGGPVTVFYLNAEASQVLVDIAPGKGKVVAREFVRELTLSQLELFIDISCQGDGHHYRQGTLDIWQRRREGLGAFELALILSGRATSYHEGDGHTVSGLLRTRQRPGKAVNGRREVVVKPYTGVVWCPTTENGTWLARREGHTYFTGNSAWLVAEDEVKLVVAPMAETFCHAMTTGAVNAMVTQLGLDPKRYTVWYDASELELRPDKTADAKELHDRGLLTDEVLLKEHGFSVQDMPEQTVRDLMLLRKMLEANASLAPLLLPMLGINVDTSVLDEAAEITDATAGGAPTPPSGGTEPDAPEAPPASPANPIPDKPEEV